MKCREEGGEVRFGMKCREEGGEVRFGMKCREEGIESKVQVIQLNLN
jgi:hypothetical protein